ncbi:DUF6112 family protein [Microlunatus sp. GCM10028923]|uniref:DUF6112 family protein n=1 Tax=Microlunatus sp. GCM10028923 TaxID=3273400 RepID=UPI0036227CD5
MGVYPDFDGLAGIGELGDVAGALLTTVLIMAVLMIIVSAVIWALAAARGNSTAAAKWQVGMWVAVVAAGLAGGAVAWMNFLINLGSHL